MHSKKSILSHVVCVRIHSILVREPFTASYDETLVKRHVWLWSSTSQGPAR